MNAGLLDAMRQAAESGDPRDRAAVYEAMSQAEVVVPLRTPNGDSEIVAVTGRDGAPVIVAFTDLDALRNWTDTGAWGSLRGDELASLALARGAAGLLLNVHGPFGGELDRRELGLIASGGALEIVDADPYLDVLTVREGAETSVQAAPSVPRRLAEATREAAGERKDIASVHALSITAGFAPPRLALGVCLTGDASWEVVAAGFAELLGSRIRDEVDLVQLSQEQLSELADCTPLYTREP